MQVVLVMFRSDGEQRSFSVTRDVTVIGRREDCDLRIPLSEVSRKHCRFIKDGDSIRIEDLGSSNGSYHNGQRVQEAMLSPGDTIQIGPVVFCIQIDGYPVEEEMAPIYHAPEEDGSEHSSDMSAEVTGDEILPAEDAEEQYETVEDETLEELPVAQDEEQFETLEEEPVALEEEPLETLGEVPLAIEEPAVRSSTPPPLPPPLPMAAEDETTSLAEVPAEEELIFEEEPVPAEDQAISLEDDVVGDFEILEEDSEEEIDSKHKK